MGGEYQELGLGGSITVASSSATNTVSAWGTVPTESLPGNAMAGGMSLEADMMKVEMSWSLEDLGTEAGRLGNGVVCCQCRRSKLWRSVTTERLGRFFSFFLLMAPQVSN